MHHRLSGSRLLGAGLALLLVGCLDPFADRGEGEGEGEGEGAAEGEGEGGTEGEGEGGTEGEGEGGAEGEGEGDAVLCAELGTAACLEQAGCVLELAAEGGYACREARDDCERQRDGRHCEATAGCVWDPGSCWCPPDSETPCACGGGPPPGCRRVDQPPPCRPREPFCPEGTICCAQGRDPLGACVPAARCGLAGPLRCEVRLELRRTGGLCEAGACDRTLRLQDTNYLFVDDETAATPVDGWLPAERAAELERLLAELLDKELAEGYGPCCNAYLDGGDDYLTLYRRGEPLPVVRISDREQAPEPLRRLLDLLDGQIGRLLDEAAGSPAACPGLASLPGPLDPTDPTPSCAATERLATAAPAWTLRGPDGQRLGGGELVLADGPLAMGESRSLILPARVTEKLPGGGWRLKNDADGGLWELGFLLPPGPLPYPLPCLVVGQQVEVAAHVQAVWDGYLTGLRVADARGVLFAIDDGLAGVHLLPDAPFQVEVFDAGCPVDEEAAHVRQAEGLTFLTPTARLDLLTGQWGVLPVATGYDLAVLDLRSFSSNLADDHATHAWLALALAGSDRLACGGW